MKIFLAIVLMAFPASVIRSLLFPDLDTINLLISLVLWSAMSTVYIATIVYLLTE